MTTTPKWSLIQALTWRYVTKLKCLNDCWSVQLGSAAAKHCSDKKMRFKQRLLRYKRLYRCVQELCPEKVQRIVGLSQRFQVSVFFSKSGSEPSSDLDWQMSTPGWCPILQNTSVKKIYRRSFRELTCNQDLYRLGWILAYVIIIDVCWANTHFQ